VLKKDVSIFARGAYAVSRHLGTADTRRRNVGEILDLDATTASCCGHDPNVLRCGAGFGDGAYVRHWVTTSDVIYEELRRADLGADTTAMCFLATLVSQPKATAWSILADASMRPEAKMLVRELGEQITRPAAWKLRVERSANSFLGSQHCSAEGPNVTTG
jgi:hypothetical protein